jgi:hypothetical protein
MTIGRSLRPRQFEPEIRGESRAPGRFGLPLDGMLPAPVCRLRGELAGAADATRGATFAPHAAAFAAAAPEAIIRQLVAVLPRRLTGAALERSQRNASSRDHFKANT